MRTKKEILDYIDSQPWKDKFYKYAFEYGRETKSFDGSIISSNFYWADTEEGIGFWKEIAEKYLKWYNAKEHAVTSWEEYCEKVPVTNEDYYYSNRDGLMAIIHNYNKNRDPETDVNIMPKDLCVAFHAYMKLVQLKSYWDKDYNYDEYVDRYKLVFLGKKITASLVSNVGNNLYGFYFPTREYAEEFYSIFEDLFKIAKPIL